MFNNNPTITLLLCMHDEHRKYGGSGYGFNYRFPFTFRNQFSFSSSTIVNNQLLLGRNTLEENSASGGRRVLKSVTQLTGKIED